MSDTESARRAAFKACPILADYLATALQDLQHNESDDACTESRDERDSGTIYDCSDSVLEWARNYCERFLREQLGNVEACQRAGLMTWERIGSTLYLASVGHGVGFTDDGRAPCLERLDQWARDNRRESLYFGDDGNVYA